jgi:hypothetical protein
MPDTKDLAPDAGGLPNPWASLLDYLKTLLAVSAALLGASVTFSDKILSETPSISQAWALRSSWCFWLLSAIAAVLATMLTVNYLKNRRRGLAAIFLANAAFFLFLLATLSLLVVGFQRTALPLQRSVEMAAEKGIAAARAFSPADSRGYVNRVESVRATNQYRLMVVLEPSGVTYDVLIDVDTGRVATASRVR